VDEAAARAGRALAQLMPGDVLVAPFVHPAWFEDVRRASGVITRGGGWLSKIAIHARERNIAMIVGVRRWAEIPDGAHVTLELDGSIKVDAAPVAPRVAEVRALAQSEGRLVELVPLADRGGAVGARRRRCAIGTRNLSDQQRIPSQALELREAWPAATEARRATSELLDEVRALLRMKRPKRSRRFWQWHQRNRDIAD
jgi:phosphohistidine swiveling domain-containing protein